MMKELIDFVSRYDADFPRKIRGAGEEDLSRLEKLAGRKLPEAYREFLRHMGRNMGGMGIITVSFNIDDIEHFHASVAKEFNWPPRFLLIGEHQQDPYNHYFMDLDTPHNGDCRIVTFDSQLDQSTLQPADVHERAPSLRQLLLQTAFLGKVMGRFPHQERTVLTYARLRERRADSKQALALLEKTALLLGFQRVPFSTPTHLMLERGDAAVYAKAGLPGMVAMTLLGEDKFELLRIREVFSDQSAEG